MRVAPADMAVHTRVYHDLTGTLPGIPVGIAGGKETLRKLLYPTGRGCNKRDTSCPCPTLRSKRDKTATPPSSHKQNRSNTKHTGNETHATPPRLKRSHTLMQLDLSRLRVKISRRTRSQKRNHETISLPVVPRTATTRDAPVRVVTRNTCVEIILGNPIQLQYTLSSCKLENVNIFAGPVFHTRVY